MCVSIYSIASQRICDALQTSPDNNGQVDSIPNCDVVQLFWIQKTTINFNFINEDWFLLLRGSSIVLAIISTKLLKKRLSFSKNQSASIQAPATRNDCDSAVRWPFVLKGLFKLPTSLAASSRKTHEKNLYEMGDAIIGSLWDSILSILSSFFKAAFKTVSPSLEARTKKKIKPKKS